MLVLMFIFMLFNPAEDSPEEFEDKENSEQEDLINEIGEIARDFANATLHLEKISSNLNQIQDNQINVYTTLNEVSKNLLRASSPNNEMLAAMKEINISLADFQKNIEFLNTELHKIQLQQIETAIQSELSKIISSKLQNA
jgi:septal ring factor EnvC (AmiA/AmiB activator)